MVITQISVPAIRYLGIRLNVKKPHSSTTTPVLLNQQGFGLTKISKSVSFRAYSFCSLKKLLFAIQSAFFVTSPTKPWAQKMELPNKPQVNTEVVSTEDLR